MIKNINISLNKQLPNIKLSSTDVIESFKKVEKDIEKEILINIRKRALSKQYAKKFHAK